MSVLYYFFSSSITWWRNNICDLKCINSLVVLVIQFSNSNIGNDSFSSSFDSFVNTDDDSITLSNFDAHVIVSCLINFCICIISDANTFVLFCVDEATSYTNWVAPPKCFSFSDVSIASILLLTIDYNYNYDYSIIDNNNTWYLSLLY